MAARLVNVDRDTPLLLSPDLREWVPEDDLVHLVIEAVNGMDLPCLKVNRRGSGSAQYPPKMMLSLLIYCYANGMFGSRRIERATYLHVAVRSLTGDTHPDHDTICKFRRENFDAVNEAFLQVLKLAREMKVLKVGTVSVDGTHIHASASKDQNVRYDRAGELDEQLKMDIDGLMQQAEQADQQGSEADGQSLPEEIARREALREKVQAARQRIETDEARRAEAERDAYERKLAEREQREGSRKAKPPKPPDPTPRDEQQTNLTDPDSKLMRKSRSSGYTQSYNCQATVDADGSQMILAGHVSNCASDANELEPAVEAVDESLGEVETVLADSGYVNAEAFDRLEEQGKNLHVSVGRESDHNERRYDYRPKSATDKPAKQHKDPRLKSMRDKLQTDEGKATYAKRKHTAEPPFGIIKSAIGFTRFTLRGLDKVTGEWSLMTLAYNLKRLHNLQPAG